METNCIFGHQFSKKAHLQSHFYEEESYTRGHRNQRYVQIAFFILLNLSNTMLVYNINYKKYYIQSLQIKLHTKYIQRFWCTQTRPRLLANQCDIMKPESIFLILNIKK